VKEPLLNRLFGTEKKDLVQLSVATGVLLVLITFFFVNKLFTEVFYALCSLFIMFLTGIVNLSYDLFYKK
jgi:VIT1/CCC1 family predicted Fe2+/Mn2+ transporter